MTPGQRYLSYESRRENVMNTHVIEYYVSADCCGAAENGDGWECGKHSRWRTTKPMTEERANRTLKQHGHDAYVETVEEHAGCIT